MRLCIPFFTGSLIAASPALAQVVVFDLRAAGIESVDGGDTFYMNRDDVQARVSAQNGALNQGPIGFGIAEFDDNAEPNGREQLVNSGESLTITFNVDVVWNGFTSSLQSDGHCSRAMIGSTTLAFWCGSGVITTGADTAVPAGTSIHFSADDSNGFSLDSFSVSTSAVDPDDVDGDGVPNSQDSDPNNRNVCVDSDGDGCDDCTSDSFDPAADGEDLDRDGICDFGDVDADGDGVTNDVDPDPQDRFECGDSDVDRCDDCRLSGGPADPDNDGNGGCDTPINPLVAIFAIFSGCSSGSPMALVGTAMFMGGAKWRRGRTRRA